MKRRVRSVGRGRQARRALARGGTGPAERLNEGVAAMSGVQITPMFGRWGYFVGPTLFACYPLKPKERDLWIRLTPEDQRRALREAGVRPHRRFARRGWVEMTIEEQGDVGRALRWVRRAHAAAMHGQGTDEEGIASPEA